MELFRKLQLWMDPEMRPGPEAMAVDEWLLETARLPVLRIYRWAGDWASLGYFGEIAAARAAFPGIGLVRRWTGGGMVDHRADWTYTLVVPQGEPLAGLRGTGSYREIHEKLADSLDEEGLVVRLSDGHEETGAALCFANPVTHDVLGAGSAKLAGAGQRRSRQGLLHQGSVAAACPDELTSRCRAERLARKFSLEWEDVAFNPDAAGLAQKVAVRYASAEWMDRR